MMSEDITNNEWVTVREHMYIPFKINVYILSEP